MDIACWHRAKVSGSKAKGRGVSRGWGVEEQEGEQRWRGRGDPSLQGVEQARSRGGRVQAQVGGKLLGLPIPPAPLIACP